MSRKINIYETVENVILNWPYAEWDAVACLGSKNTNGFIDCYAIFTEDDSIFDEEFENRINESLNNNGLYLAISLGESDELCDYGITINKDFNMHFAKRYYGTWVTGQYCEIAFEEFDAEELILKYLLTIKYDVE